MALKFQLELPRRSFTINLSGEFRDGITGIYGPSGAGKSSLFRMIAGLEIPRNGSIELAGRMITDTEKHIRVHPSKRKTGVVFQEKYLFPHMSVKENLLFGKRYRKHDSLPLNTVVELLDLSKLLDSRPEKLSGGEQQRTAIGRALLPSPEILLLDEPFNALDRELRGNILYYLKKLKDELNIQMLVISHDLPDIQRLTDTIYLIRDGRCEGFGRIADLLCGNPDSDRYEGFVNTFDLYNPEKTDNGLYSCRITGDPKDTIRIPFAPARNFRAVLNPGEISVARSRVKNTSIQNQLEGRIRRLVPSGESCYCIVDTGSIGTIAKITADSLKTLKLSEGDEIFCLFKAHSLSM